MSESRITRADIDEILKLLESAQDVQDFHLKYGDVELRVSRDGSARSDPGGSAMPSGRASSRNVSPTAVGSQVSAPATPEVRRQREAAIPEGRVVVKAPMVGTFYRAPSPGAKAFVEVGDRVAEDTVVCIIEVMKLMNTIHAGTSGMVREIRVENSQPVEFGQILIVIEPVA
jgi:acetyl-CoA carboxylase biotin carboxyl carrier protein